MQLMTLPMMKKRKTPKRFKISEKGMDSCSSLFFEMAEDLIIKRSFVSCRMINRIICILFIVNLFPTAHGQSFFLFDESGTLSAGDTISIDISYEDYDISVPIGITNTSGYTHAVNVTRYEVDVLANTSSYFCWGSCTGVTPAGAAPVVTPSGSVNIGAGVTLPANDNGFVFHYDPNFQIGTSLFKINFFDVSNPADSAFMYISIRSMDIAGIKELREDLQGYPNPASTELLVHVDHGYEGSAGEISLLDLNGSVLESQQYLEGDAIYVFDVSRLDKGVYLIRYSSSKGEVSTLKIIRQ